MCEPVPIEEFEFLTYRVAIETSEKLSDTFSEGAGFPPETQARAFALGFACNLLNALNVPIPFEEDTYATEARDLLFDIDNLEPPDVLLKQALLSNRMVALMRRIATLA